MYNIIDQSNQVNMFLLSNGTNSSSTNGVKIDCAKECPCGVPVIPVPDQWLEVMVTGGFKVWHIIFIIIAFVVTIIVVYCCFHRCRIPRTKQEIEADLMRMNLASKFREYLQEFPNEPTTFMDALKKVQELEEKSSEQDDSGARKRKGWLKLKGKEKQEKQDDSEKGLEKTELEPKLAGAETEADQQQGPLKDSNPSLNVDKTATDQKIKTDVVDPMIEPLTALKPLDFRSMKRASDRGETKPDKILENDVAKTQTVKSVSTIKEKKSKSKDAKLVKTKGDKVLDEGDPQEVRATPLPEEKMHVSTKPTPTETTAVVTSSKPPKVRRRKDKPNLSRSKAAHVSSRAESIEKPNQLNLSVPSHVQRHHHHHDHENSKPSTSSPTDQVDKDKEPADIRDRKHAKSSKSKSSTSGMKVRAPKDSTVIQIEPATKSN